MTLQTEVRNADLMDLAAILREQHARKLDVVLPAASIRAEEALLIVDGGVSHPAASGRFRPTAVCDEGIADKLRVPVAYLKRLRAERPDLYDVNINGWLHGTSLTDVPVDVDHPPFYAEGDNRSFLVRTFRGDPMEGAVVEPHQPFSIGVARAFLSDSFKLIDNLDVLTAGLEGIRASGTEVIVDGCDLTERRMSIRVIAPAVTALAPQLLAGYRSPFDQGVQRAGWSLERGREAAAREGLGYGAGEEPIVFGGFVLSNSETGGGAFSITPRFVVKVCANGLTITVDMLRNVHLGGRMDEGIVRWSDETQERNLELVASQAKDAVTTFLDVDYVRRKVAEINDAAGQAITRPEEQVKIITKRLGISEERTNDVLAHFIMGGQMTAGGVLNAITSVAQIVDDADEASELEAVAVRALETVPA